MGGRPPKQWWFPESLEEKEKSMNYDTEPREESLQQGYNAKATKRDIVYQWKARMAYTDMRKLGVKPQSTQ